MPDITMPALFYRAKSLCIFANASTDAAARTGYEHAVATSPGKLRLHIDVATGGVIEIYGIDRCRESDGTMTDIQALLGTFSANDVLVVEANPRWDAIYAKTTTKPSAGTAKVYLVRQDI